MKSTSSTISHLRLLEIVDCFADKKILVIGDVILDEFIWGKVSRISPEAPVPVVEVIRESYYPGGAANVARNLREFSGDVRMMGLVGDCQHAAKLRQLLVGDDINLDALQHDANCQTIVKTRVLARQQQVVRVDREKVEPAPQSFVEAALAQLEKMLPEIDAVIVEDYAKGLLQQEFATLICALTHKAGKILAIDPNPKNPLAWKHASVIKPNRLEAFDAAGKLANEPAENPLEDAPLLEVGKILSQKWDAENLLITLSEDGMILFRQDEAPYHSPTRAREVFDVSGAGDTVIAFFTLALCSGATPAEAAEIANHASGVVVGKLGTATVSREELLASFHRS